MKKIVKKAAKFAFQPVSLPKVFVSLRQIGQATTDAATPKIIGVKNGKNITIDATAAPINNIKKKYDEIFDNIIQIEYHINCTRPRGNKSIIC